jgi:putative hydrolase of the HAD superfamily
MAAGVRAPRRFRAVLLDAVGTLVLPREPIGETYARLAREHGVDLPVWRIEDAFRRVLAGAPPLTARDDAGDRAWWRSVVRATFRAADQTARFDDFERFFAALFAYFAAPAAWRAAPEAAAALDALRASGRRIAVASNFDARLGPILVGLGLAPLVDLVWLPRDAGTAKPDPRFFTGACARLGVSPGAAVAVGDDPEQDLAASRRAGLAAIDVGSLASLRELRDRIDALECHAPEDPSRR